MVKTIRLHGPELFFIPAALAIELAVLFGTI
jgi:hypothetical protein